MFCMHTCLESESLLNGFDMCLEPSAEHYLSINGFEWESPELASLENAPLSNIQSPYPETCVPVQGHLKQHSDFWLKELKPSSFVEGIITKGYQLPFVRLPDPVCMFNHKSALENSLFVTTAIEEVQMYSCVVECATCPTVSSLLSVVFNAKGKPRLVVDLRYINQFLPECSLTELNEVNAGSQLLRRPRPLMRPATW